MSKIKYLSISALFSILLVGVIGTAVAQTASPNTEIRGIGTGYGQDQFIIYTPIGLTITNPANCPATDGYGARIDYLGYKTHLSTAQLAFALGKPVTVVVSNTAGDCLDGRPRMLSVIVYK